MPCTTHKRSIIDTIIEGVDESVFKADDVEKQPYLSEENEFLNYVEQEDSLFTPWLNKIVKSADDVVERHDDGDNVSVYYNLDFATDFIRLCKLLPLWSGISCDIFGIDEVTASSANVESDFKNVKQSLADSIPCSVDSFVEIHIESLRGDTIEASHNRNYLKFVGDTDDKESVGEIANSSGNGLIESPAQSGNQSKLSIDCDSIDQNKILKTICSDGGTPGGAHHCIQCKRAVHILACCSMSIGDEEGYGESRLCNLCASKMSSDNCLPLSQSVSQTVSEMTHKEEWRPISQSKKQTKVTSKYLNPAPNWNISNNIKQKVKLGILQNGNTNSTVCKIDKNNVTGLRNTCTFDCVCQVRNGIN